jgi:hypothetical protein
MKRYACAVLLAALAGCGGVQIKPEPVLPKALVRPLPARVGLVIQPEMRNLQHKETRWGVGWQVALGAGHVRLARDLFKSEFGEVVEFSDLATARAAPGLKAIFEPRIEQYSFATARETGGRHYAVTIRYRINLFAPDGTLADSYTLTGYGSALAKGMSSGRPLERASRAALRDAAAKFLVQFPDQQAGKLLAKNEPVVAEKAAAAGDSTPGAVIEAVPIYEPKVPGAVPSSTSQPAGPGSTPPVPKAETPQSQLRPADGLR